MDVRVGTFNLNNLFSRFNFQGAIEAIQDTDGAAGSITVRYEFTDPTTFRIRTFLGKLVKAKDPEDTQTIADRILEMDVDVLAVQEVENIEILRKFNQDKLGGLYPFNVLIEGNDPRFIDVGVLSKLPVGAVTSHQTAIHPADPGQRVFGRDLLEVEILNPSRTTRLFTLFNNHLKSHFVPFDQDQVQGAIDANARRRRQAETISEIVGRRLRKGSDFIVTGDMNDPPDSPDLASMLTIDDQPLINALANPAETRPAKAETIGPGPQSPAWTHRFKESGQPPRHELLDQIWLSQGLSGTLTDAIIDRRTKHGGDGSDHDPAWITLSL